MTLGDAAGPLIHLQDYVSIILLSSQMLNSTLEEKENRVTEMVLTTLNPTTLIVGKVIARFMVSLAQILVFQTLVVIGYLFFREKLALPDVDLSHLSFEPWTMIVGALLLIGGFTDFTGVSSRSARSCPPPKTPERSSDPSHGPDFRPLSSP
ncbi:ABC transporter permease [Pseudarthrobacter sp. So.54]